MYNVARLNDKDRDAIFSKYAFEFGNNKSIVEKDFWVTLVLDYLFHKCEYKDYYIQRRNLPFKMFQYHQ